MRRLRVVMVLLAVLAVVAGCGGDDDDAADGSAAETAAAETTTTAAAAAAPESECDLFTAADLGDAIGVELQDGVEDFECSYSLTTEDGGVDVNFTEAGNVSNPPEDEYAEDAAGEEVTIAGAAEATYETFDTTGDVTVTDQTLHVLTEGGAYLEIRLRGVGMPAVSADQLVPVVESAIAGLEG